MLACQHNIVLERNGSYLIKWLLWDPAEGDLPISDAEKRFLLCPIEQTLADCLAQTEGFSSDAALLISDLEDLQKEAAKYDIPVLGRANVDQRSFMLEEAGRMESWPMTLVQWYMQDHRDLPWRRTQSPYAIWVSEIMLQQTRVEAVVGYFHRFMERFPSVQALAAADIDEVLKYWEGLGYYSRARNLQKAAQCIVRDHDGIFPETAEQLLKLPGIGAYTAGAIASIAFGEPVPAVDGNVLRVLTRIYAIWDDILTDHTKRYVSSLVEAHIPPQAAGEFTQSLMELGALICIPKNPRCEQCPLRAECKAHLLEVQEKLPIRLPKTKVKLQNRMIYLIFDHDKVLMHRRPEGILLGGLYEFPGVEDPEDTTQSADQIFAETYGLKTVETKVLGHAEHKFTHIHWQMTICTSKIMEHPDQLDDTWLWADRSRLDQIMIPTAFKSALFLAKQRLT